MRFSQALKVDVKTWSSETRVKIEREGSGTIREAGTSLEDLPKFGAGSEFGKVEREEARIKKYTPRNRRKLEDAPWILKVGPGKTAKRYKGIREGGVSENSSFYVFFQAHDGAFEAVPVSEWYNFNLQAKYRALTAEEAEEQFEKRDKIMNFFSVMKGKKEDGDGDTDSKPKKKKRDSRSFKVTDMDEWADSDADDDHSGPEGSDEDSRRPGKKKGGKKGKKGSDVDSEAGEESDEGDFDTREMDYISSSSSDEEDLNDRLNRELKGVEDEDGLKGLVITDSEEEEEEKKEPTDGVNDEDPNSKGPDGPDDKKKKGEKGEEISDESASDSSDSDLDEEEVDKSKSWMFLQSKKETKNGSQNDFDSNSNSNSRSQTPIRDVSSQMEAESSSSSPVASSASSSSQQQPQDKGVKRKLEQQHQQQPIPAAPVAKKPKTSEEEGVSEESIRRYLMRKPITTKELIKKFKSKTRNISSHDLVHQIGTLLKKINPEKVNIKGELYLSLKPNK